VAVYKEERGGKTYYRVDVVWTHPDGRVERIRKRSPVNTRRGAEQYERDMRNALADGTYGKRRKSEEPTLSDFRARYFTQHVSALKASTRAAQKQIWDQYIEPQLGDLRLSAISADSLSKMCAVLRERGLKPKTINNALSGLRKALESAADWEVIKRSDVPRFVWLKVEEQPFDFLAFDEADKLIAAAGEEKPWAAMIAFTLNTGLRLGELRALRLEDVDRAQRQVTVSRSAWKAEVAGTKGKRVRVVPLNDAAMAALAGIEGRRGFVFADDAKMLTKEQCKWPLWRASDKADLGRRIGWHVLRHSFASHLVMRGVSLKAVQELLGHTTLAMTMRYAHLAPNYLRGAVDALARPPSAHQEDE
jgi:site-specific recombinase XerD